MECHFNQSHICVYHQKNVFERSFYRCKCLRYENVSSEFMTSYEIIVGIEKVYESLYVKLKSKL